MLVLAAALAAGGSAFLLPSEAEARRSHVPMVGHRYGGFTGPVAGPWGAPRQGRPQVIDHRRLGSPPRPQPPRDSPPRPGYRTGGFGRAPVAALRHHQSAFVGRFVRRAAPGIRSVARVAAPIVGRRR